MSNASYWLIQGPAIYLFKTGFNPYLLFIVLVIFIFTIYFLILYRGNFNLLIKDFKELSPRKKRDLYIFTIGGLLMGLIVLYGVIESGYRSSYIDNKGTTFGESLLSFLEKIGLVK
jgi:hypothetical protein